VSFIWFFKHLVKLFNLSFVFIFYLLWVNFIVFIELFNSKIILSLFSNWFVKILVFSLFLSYINPDVYYLLISFNACILSTELSLFNWFFVLSFVCINSFISLSIILLLFNIFLKLWLLFSSNKFFFVSLLSDSDLSDLSSLSDFSSISNFYLISSIKSFNSSISFYL